MKPILYFRKRCKDCKKVKPLGQFGKHPGYRDGRTNTCKECELEKHKAQRRKAMVDDSNRLRARRAIEGMRQRAREQGVPFDADYFSTERVAEMLCSQKACSCCKRALDFSGENKKMSPSFDKVVPSLGYTKENTAILCYECNTRKNNSTAADLRMIADFIDNWGR